MKKYIHINWRLGNEVIEIDLNEKPLIDEIRQTHEYWEADDTIVTYKTNSVRHVDDKGRQRIVIYYTKENNSELVGQYSATDALWGKSIITFKTGSKTGLAEWKSSPPNPDLDGRTTCRIIDQGLYKREEREAVYRNKRQQAQFKELLWSQYGRCAVTKERMMEIVDAAHIIESRFGGAENISNGILLRADIHRMYDAGIFSIELDGSLNIKKDVPAHYFNLLSSASIDSLIIKRITAALKQRHKHMEKAKSLSSNVED